MEEKVWKRDGMGRSLSNLRVFSKVETIL